MSYLDLRTSAPCRYSLYTETHPTRETMTYTHNVNGINFSTGRKDRDGNLMVNGCDDWPALIDLARTDSRLFQRDVTIWFRRMRACALRRNF